MGDFVGPLVSRAALVKAVQFVTAAAAKPSKYNIGLEAIETVQIEWGRGASSLQQFSAVQPSKGLGMTLVATDRYRLHVAEVAPLLSEEWQGDPDVHVSMHVETARLLAWARAAKAGNAVLFEKRDEGIEASVPGEGLIVLPHAHVDGSGFPGWKRLLPDPSLEGYDKATSDLPMILDVDMLASTLGALKHVTANQHASLPMARHVEVHVANDDRRTRHPLILTPRKQIDYVTATVLFMPVRVA